MGLSAVLSATGLATVGLAYSRRQNRRFSIAKDIGRELDKLEEANGELNEILDRAIYEILSSDVRNSVWEL